MFGTREGSIPSHGSRLLIRQSLMFNQNLEQMTNEELKKLTVLQQDIQQLKEISKIMKTHKIEIKFPSYSNYFRYPLDKVDDCENQVTYLLKEMLDEKLIELEDKFNSLALCKQVTGGPSYIPTEL
jgi:hypothetical protein